MPAECQTGGKRNIRHITIKFKKIRNRSLEKGTRIHKGTRVRSAPDLERDIRTEIIKWHFKDSEVIHSVRVQTVRKHRHSHCNIREAPESP